MKAEIKAIFFDIGETLVAKSRYPEKDIKYLKEMVALLNLNCSAADLLDTVERGQQKYKSWCALTLNELTVEEKWAKFLLPELDSELVRKLAPRLQELWRKSKGLARIRDNALPVLREIGERGYVLGTISHSTPAYLEDSEIDELLKVHIHAPQFGKRKPHPSLFVEAARQCGISPELCAYIGDNPLRDVVGPREAGFGRVILMRNGATGSSLSGELMKPDLEISDLNDLLAIFPRREKSDSGLIMNMGGRALYDAALSTMHWDKERFTADEFFGGGRKLGFARFELNHQIPPEVLAQIDVNRFSIGSLHDPCPAYTHAKVLEESDIQITSLDETLRRKGVDVVKGTIDQACRLGCRLVVVHPGRITGDHSLDNQLRALYNGGHKGSAQYEELRLKTISDRAARAAPHLERCLQSLREIIDFARDSGVMIGLENRFHYYELPIYNEMQAMLDEFSEPWVGWQYDVGHLQVHDQLGLLDTRAWLEKFSSRIIGLHFHDVMGIKDHQAPGTGDVDFQLIARFLPPDCYCTLEVDKALTFDDVAKGMQHLYDQGCIRKL